MNFNRPEHFCTVVGFIRRKERYTASISEAFISFLRDDPLFPEEP